MLICSGILKWKCLLLCSATYGGFGLKSKTLSYLPAKYNKKKSYHYKTYFSSCWFNKEFNGVFNIILSCFLLVNASGADRSWGETYSEWQLFFFHQPSGWKMPAGKVQWQVSWLWLWPPCKPLCMWGQTWKGKNHGDFASLYNLSTFELLHGDFPLIMAISNEKIIWSELLIIIKGTQKKKHFKCFDWIFIPPFKSFGPVSVFNFFYKKSLMLTMAKNSWAKIQ